MIATSRQTEQGLGIQSVSPVENSSAPCIPSSLVPRNVRVVALVVASTGTVIRHDCYDEGGDTDTMSGVMRRKDGQLWLRRIDWARSDSDAEVCLQWHSTGLALEDINRISVFTWPEADPVRVFVNSE